MGTLDSADFAAGNRLSAQDQQTPPSSDQQGDSLAAAARRTQEQKKEQPKAAKVWDNDSIPFDARWRKRPVDSKLRLPPKMLLHLFESAARPSCYRRG